MPFTTDDYDWVAAFTEAGDQVSAALSNPLIDTSRVDIAGVAETIASDDGENGGAPWVGVFRLNDGRFVFLEAGCDYTGWDCQASGQCVVGADLNELIRFGIGESDRRRLGLELAEDR